MLFWGRSQQELELDEAVRATAKVATQWEAVPLRSGETPPITATKFGGTPYAEAGEDWPRIFGRPYDFVAQLNLRDCFEPPTSPCDLITIFIFWGVLEDKLGVDEFNEAFDKVCVVRSYREPSEAKAVAMAKPPGQEKNDYQVVPCAAQSRRILSYPSPVEFQSMPGLVQLAAPPTERPQGFVQWLAWGVRRLFQPIIPPTAEQAALDAYIAALQRIVGYTWRREVTRVGGYASWVHANTFDDDGLFFIAQIAYEPAANNCIGDAAPLFIAAHRSDPTRFEADPWQTG